MALLTKLFSARKKLRSSVARVPDEMILYAVCDIHGRDDLLRDLIANIVEDLDLTAAKPVLLFLGDYIDRSFGSKAVIDFLLSDALAPSEPRFLKENHEATRLDFLRDGDAGPQWTQYGGADTLRAYGVNPPNKMFDQPAWKTAHEQFATKLPLAHLQFFEALELYAHYGDYCFVRADLRPGVPIDQQVDNDLLWSRDEFLNHNRPFGHVVVHGHSASLEPSHSNIRIGVDTGAYITGRLTAARLEADRVSTRTGNA